MVTYQELIIGAESLLTGGSINHERQVPGRGRGGEMQQN